MNYNQFFALPVILCVSALHAGLDRAHGQTTTQTQTAEQEITLQAGWNAVAIRVQPEGRLSDLFAGTSVEMVTTWYPEKLKVVSLQDLTAEPWKLAEWRTWQAAGQEGAFLNNLHALEAGRGYLVKAKTAGTIRITGALGMERLSWTAQSFNLVALPADPESPPDFASFFASSAAHRPMRIYKMQGGIWQAVRGTDRIDAHAAYWVWCGEGSEYQGPLDVRASGGLALQQPGDKTTVSLVNATSAPLEVKMTAAGELPLAAGPTGSAALALGTIPTVFTANADGITPWQISRPVGTTTTSVGATTLLEIRAAGVLFTLPVRQ